MASIDTKAPQILQVVGVFYGLAMLTVILRVYSRAVLLKVFGPDDYVMLAATVLLSGKKKERKKRKEAFQKLTLLFNLGCHNGHYSQFCQIDKVWRR